MLAQNAKAQSDLKALDHADYDKWNSIGATQISNDGKWISFSVTAAKKDSETTLHIRRNGTAKEYVIERAASTRFTFDSKYAIYRVTPPKARLKELTKAKLSSEELPAGKLEILNLETGQRSNFDRVTSFSIPQENGRWVAFLDQDGADKKLAQSESSVNESLVLTESGLAEPEKKLKLKPRREDPTKMPELKTGEKKEASKESNKKVEQAKPSDGKPTAKPEVKKKSIGKTLVIRDLDTGLQKTFPYVVRFSFDKHGKRLAFVTSVIDDTSKMKKDDDKKTSSTNKNRSAAKKPDNDESLTDGIYIVDLDDLEMTPIATGVGEYTQVTFNEKGDQIAFMTNRDNYLVKSPSWSIYHWKSGAKTAASVVSESSAGIPKGWWIPPSTSISFSEDGKRFYFSTAPVPESIEKERKGKSDEADDKAPQAKLDLWHWQDPKLQPQQLLQAASERNRSYRAAFDIKSAKVLQLATKSIPSISIDTRSPAEVAVASSDVPYQKMMSWDVPGFSDAYLINLKTGQPETLIEKTKSSLRLSPEGKFVTWFDSESKKWFAMSTGKDREAIEISKGIRFPLFDELHDTPSLPPSYGSAGWMKDDAAFLVYDRYDIWKLDPTGNEPPVCLTEQQGRKTKIRLRAITLDREARAFDPAQPIFLNAFDETTKASGVYQLTLEQPTASSSKSESSVEFGLKKLMMLDESLGRLNKARESNDVIFTRSTFRDYPDVWSSTLEFKKVHRISDANPQQKDYRWGTAELVQWKAKDGQELEGLLYKPDDFDPTKKYPMMVYFYERNADTLHRYYTPAAGRSIINFSFYVSRGYVVFVPDIPYTTGEPGPSAANAILPGVESLVAKGFINKDKIGMQGHSWGGYQTAYLVTQTDMFACAESGAPVSNMTSAYGGIRWSSGMSRMLQYERTQSRIGEDLWKARDKYIANSPIFFADKVNTPLLILHNDEDGAVPWYQGIELFVALRRLEKPAWLLNYNGDPHWVMSDENRMDFAKRMQQFFDHYLMDAPEPEWMAYGIPAVEKGKSYGFDLLEPEKEEKK